MSSLPIVGPAAEHAGSPAPDVTATTGSRPDLRDEDLRDVLVAFYAAVAREPLLGIYFAKIDMSAHMPRIIDFWSTLLFHTGRYTGNAFRPHLDMPGLTAGHFSRWLATLERVVDEAHVGENAERMKELGHRVAYSMQLRLGIAPAVG